jgi:hypothetical protein
VTRTSSCTPSFFMIDIVVLDELHYKRMGIYRIWFGWKFYIGATADTAMRIKGHYKAIKDQWDEPLTGRNSVVNIVRHLHAHPFIQTAFFELLEVCEREIDLVDAEYDWLCNFQGDPDCLNENFHVCRRFGCIMVFPNGTHKIKRGGKYVHF